VYTNLTMALNSQDPATQILNDFASDYARNLRMTQIRALIKSLEKELDHLAGAGDPICPECGHTLEEELLSTDLDGLRKEFGYVCHNCG